MKKHYVAMAVSLPFLCAGCLQPPTVTAGCDKVGVEMLHVNAEYDAKRITQQRYDEIATLFDRARMTCRQPPPADPAPVVAFLEAAQ